MIKKFKFGLSNVVWILNHVFKIYYQYDLFLFTVTPIIIISNFAWKHKDKTRWLIRNEPGFFVWIIVLLTKNKIYHLGVDFFISYCFFNITFRPSTVVSDWSSSDKYKYRYVKN